MSTAYQNLPPQGQNNNKDFVPNYSSDENGSPVQEDHFQEGTQNQVDPTQQAKNVAVTDKVHEVAGQSFKTQQNDDPEPQRCPDSMLKQNQQQQNDDSKVRLIQAQEIIKSQAQDMANKPSRIELLEMKNQYLEERLLEADDLVQQMSQLIDVSRNKNLQRKLLKFNDRNQAMKEAMMQANATDSQENTTLTDQQSQSETYYKQPNASLQTKGRREQSNVRVRDTKRKKSKNVPQPEFNLSMVPNQKVLAPLNTQKSLKKRENSASNRNNQSHAQGFNLRGASPIQEKRNKKYKRKGGHPDMQTSGEGQFGGQMINSSNLNVVQNVDQFKNFLLQNDSQFSEYLQSDLLRSTFDTHMMKEGMITFMAQMMGNGSAKDNFFLKTRAALQDTMTLFYITKNISFNNNIEFYLPRLVEMLSDLLEVERCSIFLYDGIKDQLYCKVITGRLREAISYEREKTNILSTVFNTGQNVYVKDCSTKDSKAILGEYTTMDQKLHTVTRNVLVAPIKLGNNAIGCLEVANKKKVQDFTSNDISILKAVCDQISNGLIAHEMKYNIKKESDEELRYIKGLMNQSLNQFLIPMISEINQLCVNVLKSERVIFFMYNKDIDHLYSISSKSNQVVGQFGIDSIRMKSTLGLSGSAFTHGRIMIERDIDQETKDQKSVLCPEEKDLKKLNITSLKNAIAIPIFDKQTGTSIAIVQAYNFDEQNYLNSIDEGILMSLSNIFSSTIFNVDNLQGMMTNSDLLQAQYDLVNEGCIFLNTQQMLTKVNKSAEIMFNTTSSNAIGLQIAEFLGTKNNHFINAINTLTNRASNDNDASGSLADKNEELKEQHLRQEMIGTYLISDMGRESKNDPKQIKVPINFYIHRLTSENQKTYGFCLVFQPIVIM